MQEKIMQENTKDLITRNDYKRKKQIIDKSGNINQWGKIVSNQKTFEKLPLTVVDLSSTYMNAFKCMYM